MNNKIINKLCYFNEYNNIETQKQYLYVNKIDYYNRILLIHYLRIGDINNIINIKKNIILYDYDQVIIFFVRKMIINCLKNDNIDDAIKIKKEFNLKYTDIMKYNDFKYILQNIINDYIDKGDIESVKRIREAFKSE